MRLPNSARNMHKFSTAATKSSALTAFRSVGLLNVLQRVRLRWRTRKRVPLARLARSSLASLRYKNLCIIRANLRKNQERSMAGSAGNILWCLETISYPFS